MVRGSSGGGAGGASCLSPCWTQRRPRQGTWGCVPSPRGGLAGPRVRDTTGGRHARPLASRPALGDRHRETRVLAPFAAAGPATARVPQSGGREEHRGGPRRTRGRGADGPAALPAAGPGSPTAQRGARTAPTKRPVLAPGHTPHAAASRQRRGPTPRGLRKHQVSRPNLGGSARPSRTGTRTRGSRGPRSSAATGPASAPTPGAGRPLPAAPLAPARTRPGLGRDVDGPGAGAGPAAEARPRPPPLFRGRPPPRSPRVRGAGRGASGSRAPRAGRREDRQSPRWCRAPGAGGSPDAAPLEEPPSPRRGSAPSGQQPPPPSLR